MDDRTQFSTIRLSEKRDGFAVVDARGAIVRIAGNLAFKLSASQAAALVDQLSSDPRMMIDPSLCEDDSPGGDGY